MIAAQDKILVVDDEQAVRRVLCILLETEGFCVIEAADGRSCLHLVYEHHPDLVLLDILMPDRDGRDVCRLLHDIDPCLPIIMLTALSDDHEKVDRLTDGADDYVTKPFHNSELVARIRSVLRRARMSPAAYSHSYQDSVINVDFDARHLSVGDEPVRLSPKQWRILEYLVNNRDRVVARQDLLQHVWGLREDQDNRYIKVFISNLRKKLNDNPKKPRYIHTVREQGYLFESHA